MVRPPVNSVDLFLLAGEPSGDLQGAALVEELLKENPGLRITAVAGPRMRKFPIQCVEKMENLQVMGFIDVLCALPKIARMFFSLRHKILELNPKAFVGLDYPGFNLRLHRSLKKAGFKGKLIHYICPTVWAWGKGRIPQMAKTLDLLLTILPFEPACFAKTSLRVEYVGHPLTQAVAKFRPDPEFRKRHGFANTDKILALFPGSRAKEIERNLPLQLEVARKLQKQDPDLRIAISAANDQVQGIPLDEAYDLMHNAHLALAKSGTVTLELALHRVPTVIHYAIKPLDMFLATRVFNIRLPYYGLPNLILGKEVFPELFGPNLTLKALESQSSALWFEEPFRSACTALCEELRAILCDQAASRDAALQILNAITI